MASFKSLLFAANAATISAFVLRYPPPPSSNNEASRLVYRNVSSVVDAATGGQPQFADVTCGFEDVGNARADGPTRWAEADADNAFSSFNNAWNNELAGQGLSYVRSLSSFWNGPENWDVSNPTNCSIL